MPTCLCCKSEGVETKEYREKSPDWEGREIRVLCDLCADTMCSTWEVYYPGADKTQLGKLMVNLTNRILNELKRKA